MKLSLIMATFGRADDIGRLVDSLAQQTCQDFELLVVDQNPDDRVEPFVMRARQLGLQVQHLRLARPGLSAARNVGLAAAQGNVVGFPDDDCWYEPDLVATVRDTLASQDAWGGLIACWLEQQAAHPAQTGDDALALARWRQFKGGDASSITLFFRTTLLRQVGGFDERLGVGRWYGAAEETDLLFRLLANQVVVARWPAARVHHRYVAAGSAGAARPGWRQVWRRARGTGALYIKHRLSAWIILRGLIAPVGRAVLRLDPVGLGRALASAGGRLQGAITWLVTER